MFRLALCFALLLAPIPKFNNNLHAQDSNKSSTRTDKATAISLPAPIISVDKKTLDRSVAGEKSTEATVDQRELLKPVSESEIFFSAPDQKKAPPSTAKASTADVKRPEVRLLGVGRVGKLETDETHAILKVEGKQLYRRIGDSFGDIKVVDIGRRSVTLQSDRDRWTIDLFEQSIVNQPTETDSQPQTTRRNSNQQSRRPSVLSPALKTLSAEPTLPSPQSLPTDPMLQTPELPEVDLPPPPPELPDFPNIP